MEEQSVLCQTGRTRGHNASHRQVRRRPHQLVRQRVRCLVRGRQTCWLDTCSRGRLRPGGGGRAVRPPHMSVARPRCGHAKRPAVALHARRRPTPRHNRALSRHNDAPQLAATWPPCNYVYCSCVAPAKLAPVKGCRLPGLGDHDWLAGLCRQQFCSAFVFHEVAWQPPGTLLHNSQHGVGCQVPAHLF